MASAKSEDVLCAFCRLERRVHFKKSADWTNVAISLLAAGLTMFLVWQRLDPRGVLFLVLFIMGSEVFVRLRWRMSLPCPHCAFDPLLYKTNREESVKRVKARLEQVRSSQKFLLRAQNPFEKLPIVLAPPNETPRIQLPGKPSKGKSTAILSRHA